MTALAMTAEPMQVRRTPDEFSWSAMRLSGLLAATADRHRDRIAFRDQPGREEWSGRPRIDWAYPFAHEIIQRLAFFFSRLGLEPKAPVGICLPNGSEACLTLLAVEQAGYVPCLLSAAWAPGDLAAAAERAGIQAVVTQGVIGEGRPAEDFCRLAARYFGLRFVCAFGPMVPDGVIDLDRVILASDDLDPAAVPPLDATGEAGLVTFERRDGDLRPVFRSCQSVIAAAATFLVAAKIRAGERILSLLPPDDHRGITTGLIACLLSGATLECHGLFSGRALCEALDGDTPTHLVAPGWIEDALASADLPDGVASVVLVHEAPVRFKVRASLRRHVVDALAFGEMALIARARRAGGQFALSLDDDGAPAHGATRGLLRVRRDGDGAIAFSGLATEIRGFGAGSPAAETAMPEWRPSGFKADLFAGIVIGVS